MTKHRPHSVAFKRQVAEEFIAGEALHGLSKRHDVSRQLIRIWVGKFEAGALDDDVQAADLLQEYEAKIAALERMVGRQALEIALLKGGFEACTPAEKREHLRRHRPAAIPVHRSTRTRHRSLVVAGRARETHQFAPPLQPASTKRWQAFQTEARLGNMSRLVRNRLCQPARHDARGRQDQIRCRLRREGRKGPLSD